MPGSNPAGITIFRIGVTAARLTLTQEVVVQIHDPEPNTGLIQSAVLRSPKPSIVVRIHRPVPPYSPVVQLVNAPDRLSGDRGFKSRRGCHQVPSSNWFRTSVSQAGNAGSSPAGITICRMTSAGADTGPESRGRQQCHGDRHLHPAPSIRSDILTGKEPPC